MVVEAKPRRRLIIRNTQNIDVCIKSMGATRNIINGYIIKIRTCMLHTLVKAENCVDSLNTIAPNRTVHFPHHPRRSAFSRATNSPHSPRASSAAELQKHRRRRPCAALARALSHSPVDCCSRRSHHQTARVTARCVSRASGGGFTFRFTRSVGRGCESVHLAAVRQLSPLSNGFGFQCAAGRSVRRIPAHAVNASSN